MKRKLVLTFDGNKLLHATITEKGRRTRLPKITTSADALKEIKDTLSCALSVVEAASGAASASTTAGGALGQADQTYQNALRFDVGATSVESTTSVASMQEDTSRARSVCARPKLDKDLPPLPKPLSERSW